MTILTVTNLAKRYASYANNLQRFASWFGAPFTPVEEFWSAKDISFSLDAGEAIAIIGQNGAGKSTLLKLITGTVRATHGTVRLGGRVGAILELGLGFNPDFTGRENVYHAGGLMGISRARLDELMVDIEDFAEIGEFFDQPFRVYSSGMQARLAFSLVSAERPAILIVDEVLSVGDSYFQHKSFDRIRSFKESGTSIILVTHSLGDVKALCDRVILLDKGHVLKDGPPDEVVDYYNAMIAAKERARVRVEQRRSKDGWLRTRSGTLEAQVETIELLDAKTGLPVATATVGQELTLRIAARAGVILTRLVLGVMLRDRTGHVLWGTNTWHTKQVIEDVKVGETIIYEMTFECIFGPGSYSISPALTNSHTHLEANYDWSDNALVFDVVIGDRPFFVGTTALNAKFHIDRSRRSPVFDRVAMTISCRDCDVVEKVPNAGCIELHDGERVQIMHNGLMVVAGGYYGAWMADIIAALKGHHEPQEELGFHALLSHCRPGSLFVELGAFWAYYSLWYLKAVPGSEAICVEPDPNNLDVGRKNAALNGFTNRVRFVQGWVGELASSSHEAVAESIGQLVKLPCYDMAAIANLVNDRVIEILHVDAQGAELGLLRSMSGTNMQTKVRFVVVSTHHASISGSASVHADCMAEIVRQGGTILCQHTIDESYSGDGLIIASFCPEDRDMILPKVSRNKAETSLFGTP
ncbi:FkbM family methyltransferase [Bradyrhizobium sp. USDA 4532]|uniref:Wzt carbohydrate-binding domain-containing protein n=1 Tax=unclassified Bradyrhizobium TaxID=2631580 RepID=UPI00209CEEEC|nr:MULTISPECIES: Wzt carbohydrate-binding domain-containing protein [unclassified Bradyrhizobium]MCP1831684.1 FkbM family methyltransferase [Bradyrhizobium sp. USDA 4545]MCP1916521.1 FkbM family methyltransferase [Bradyrhizobium sp. USDA 4532]